MKASDLTANVSTQTNQDKKYRVLTEEETTEHREKARVNPDIIEFDSGKPPGK